VNLETWQEIQEAKVRELKELYDAGDLSESEYTELVEDLLDLQKISDGLDLEENKIRAQKAIEAIRMVAGLI
jgi:polyhydroxyalkanoate synthesis regulator phasin